MSEVLVDTEVRLPDVLHQFEFAVESLFRSEARYQYAGWPSGTTTDGSSIHTCWRSAERTVEAVGLTDFDFGPSVFPFRLVISGDGGDVRLELFIGDTNPETGRPPMLAPTTVFVPMRTSAGHITDVEMITGRHQRPILWTPAIEFVVPAE